MPPPAHEVFASDHDARVPGGDGTAKQATFVWNANYEVGPLRVWASRPLVAIVAFGPLGGLVPAAIDDGRWLLALVLHCTAIAVAWYLTVRRSRLVIDAHGVHDHRVFKIVNWSWGDVACLAVDSYGRQSGHLVACIVGDPYPKTLKGAPQRDRAMAMATLDRVRRAGWAVDGRPEDASTWWYLDPRCHPQ